MHLLRHIAIAVLILLQAHSVLAYKDKKAILVASRDMQGDTIGYNIVSEMARYIYAWMDEGKVKLWDSPEKKYTLTKDDLGRIESSTGTKFTDLSTLFIYEYWNAKKKSFRFGMEGFSFASQNKQGEEILFGFVEYSGAMKELFLAAPMKVNAQGQYGMTLWQALMNKQYDFSLVFFDGIAYTDYSKSARFIKYVTDKKRRQLNAQTVKEAKLVEYSVSGGPSEEGAHSAEIINKVQKFFNQNPQEFYNYGGDAILSYQKKSPIILTDLRIQETWVKDRKGNITVTPSFMVPYAVGIRMQPIPVSEFEKWNFYIDDKKIEEILIDKDFNYVLKSINEANVPEDIHLTVRNSLLSGSWTNLLPQQIVEKTE